MSREIWKDAAGFEQWHEVSTIGRVRTKEYVHEDGTRVPPQILKYSYGRNGWYYTVRLKSNDQTRDGRDWRKRFAWRFVHVLVAETFLGPRPRLMDLARHLNGDCYDNRVENLKWGTHKQNVADMVKHGTAAWLQRNPDGTRVHRCPNPKFTVEQAQEIRALRKYGGWSVYALAKKFRCYNYHIKRLLARQSYADVPDLPRAEHYPKPPLHHKKSRPWAFFTYSQVQTMRHLFAYFGWSVDRLCRRFKCARRKMLEILRRRRYANVPNLPPPHGAKERLLPPRICGNAKCTAEQVQKLRFLFDYCGWSVGRLCRRFKLSETAVLRVLRRTSFANVPDLAPPFHGARKKAPPPLIPRPWRLKAAA